MIPSFRNSLALLMLTAGIAHSQSSGQAPLSDYRLEPTGPHQVIVGYGSSRNLDLTLTNQSANAADWKLVFENAGTDGLAGVLERLDVNTPHLLSIIPDRYLFSEGITGSSISDGGNDMYDGGNMLAAGSTSLAYSNGVLANATVGTGSVSYFTRKLDGLFVFAADFTGVDSFAITGNLGADGSGQVAVDEFLIESGGFSYQAYVHRVHSAGDPSINQLILIPQKTGLSRTYLTTTSDENHKVAGLGASSRVYYLLFAKAAGGLYSTDVFRNLATSFLSAAKNGPSWAFGNPAEGRLDALKSGPVRLSIASAGLVPGNYSAKFAVVPQGLGNSAIPSGAFQSLDLTISPPGFTVPTSTVAVSTLSGLSPAPVDVALQPAVGGTVLSGLQASSSQTWLVPTVLDGTNNLRLTFNASSLAPGTYVGQVTVWNGETRQTFEVSLLTSALNVVKLLPDPARSRIYALNADGQERGSLLVIDALTRATLRNIPLGRKPTDCDIGDGGDALFAINSVDQTITAVNLATLAVTQTYTLPGYTNWGAEETHAHVRAGKGNILYFVDGQWGPRLRVFNRATGQVLQTFGASTTGTDNDDGVGGLVLAPNGSAIYTWKQYGWSAGVLGTYISKFRVNADGTLAIETQTASERTANFDRDPLDTPAMITSDGSRLIVKDRAFLTSNLREVAVVYPDEIYSITRGAEIAAGATAIYSGAGGEILHTLPVAAPIQAMTPDYSAMVYFNPTSRAITWLDLVATVGNKALGLQIGPSDGATVVSPDRLQWFPVTGILRYQVYVGTNRNEVEAATPTSPHYLGETSNVWFDLSTPLALGQSYFWRVLPIGADDQPAGSGITRSFLVSNLSLSRSSIDTATVEGVMHHEETITLAAATPQAWAAAANVPWISFTNASGTTPAELVTRFDATSLTPGFHTGNITLTSGGASFVVPVTLRIHPANFMIAETDLELPWVYVVSQESNKSTQPSFLLRVNTATNRIESAVACGHSVTDLAVHYQENRIYLTNWQTGILRAFDRGTFKQVQSYQFAPAGAIGYGEGGIWRVAAGKKGRLILEESDQWIDIRLINTANGAVIASNSNEYAGDGEADPTGRYYYHSEGISSSDSMVRFDLSADTFSQMTPTATGQGTSVVMIGDGSKVTAGSRVFDAQLGLQFTLPAEVRAATLHGDLLFTSTKAYNGTSGLEMATLPSTAEVMSVTGDQKKLYLFPANTKTFRVVDLATIAALPPREIVPTIADGSTVIGTSQTLGWSIEPFASSYRVYFGTDRDAVANATQAGPGYLGASATNAWTDSLPPLALDGNYFWRVDTVGFSGTRKGAVWAFNIAPLSLLPAKINVVLPVGAPLTSSTLAVSGPAGSTWTASTGTPWLSLPTAGGSTPGSPKVNLNVAGMAAGIYQGSVTFTSGTDSWSLPVSLELLALNYTLAEADLERPLIYAISQAAAGTDDRAFMVVIDTRTSLVSKVIPVGRSVTGLSAHYQENRIYVSNWQTGKLLALDRDTFQEIRTYSYGAAGGYGTSSGDVYKVAAGKAGRVVIEQQDQWVNFFLIDTATGNKLATGYAREGGGVFDPTGRFYYHGENNSSGAEIRKYDTGSNLFTPAGSKRVSGFSYFGSRRILTSGDGSRVFWNGGVFDPDLNVRLLLTNEVVSSTYRGEVIFTDKAAINGINGETLATLPVTTGVQGVSFDQRKLFLFKAGAFTVVDIATIASVPPRGLVPGIADEAVVIGTAQELSWTQEAAALSYNLYFGTSAAAVRAATTSSPEFLGNTLSNRWTGAMPALQFGGSYWWRVDVVGFNSTAVGSTWSFKIPVIHLEPKVVDLAYPAASPIPLQRLALTSPAGGGAPVPWTASTSTPWISLPAGSGTSPGNFDFTLNSTGLTAGLKEGSITFQAGGDTFTVPVRLRIIPLNVTKLLTHPTRPVVYGINTAAAGEGFSHLLEIDAATAVILRSLPVGFNPTDADLDAASDRLYVSNWGYSQTRVVDLSLWKELPSLALGEDVYKLEVTPQGRIVTEEEDQWIDLSLWNASTGSKLGSTFSVREGDGETDPTGAIYYHCDNNISNAHITKYNISGDTFTKVADGPEFGGYGSRNLILSRDGSRLFWVGRVLDSSLTVIAQMPAEVHATNHTGVLAVGASAVWWSDSGTVVGALPFESTVAVVSADDSHLLRFNSTTRTLHSTALSSFTDLPGPLPRPGQLVDASPSRLSWSPVAGATAYRVFIAADATALAAMSSPLATVLPTYYDLPSPLAFGSFYSWRVDAVTAAGITAGVARSFGIRFPQGPALAPIGGGSGGISASISDRHLLVGGDGTAQLYQYDAATGANSPVQSFTIPGHYWDHQFGSAVAVDAGKATVGAYALDNPADGGGSAFVYRAGAFGYWESSGPISPPQPVISEAFGRSLVASGNQLLVGAASPNYNRTGRVAAYVTEPATVRVQTFGASDGQAGDNFGQVIAMEGNQALVSAPGRGSSSNRLPVIYAFSRSTVTGLWTQTQKIAIPGATVRDNSGTALALSGNYFATNRESSSAVLIFSKNSSGQWVPSATISQTSVAGSSSSFFGDALALSGDQLFIGDTSATLVGSGGGGVFSFRRSGTAWNPGPVIVPGGTRSSFGRALAARDGWLLVTGTSPQPGWLFHIDAAANHTPIFGQDIPTQVVAGRAFTTQIHANDVDGNAGLTLDLLQGPAWLGLTDQSGGRATLSGIPAGNSGDVHLVQFRVRDAAGAQALHTYQLTLLAPTDLPVLTLQPVGSAVGEGQEVILRAAVSGIGPFQWQWFLDGESIPGANLPTFTLGEISLADAGAYSARVSNVVGEVISSTAMIDAHPANRFAGDWPTFGGSSRHTGYHPARLGRHTFVNAWSASIAPGRVLNRAAIGAGKVFVTPQVYFGGSFDAAARDLATGAAVWNHSFSEAYSLNPPSYHNGRVYIQRGNHGSDSQLWALSANDGSTVWSSPFSAQWGNYESPAVTDDGIWINGGSYGGMYGFDLSGTQRFFKSMSQYDNWTPTVSSGRVFSWVAGLFEEHNPVDGSTLWSVNTGWDWRGWSMNTVSAVSGDSAVVISTTEIVCIDLPSRAIRWRRTGAFLGSPAISNGRTYAIQGSKIVSFSMVDGAAGPEVTVPAPIISAQPLLVMGHMFVASSTNTYVVDLATSAVTRTLTGGGLLSYSQGYLLAAGTDGTLRAWYANGAPEFTADLPVAINAGDAAADLRLNLSNYLGQPDPGDPLTWSLVSVSNRSFFRSLQINASSGVLSVVYNPWLQGSSSAVIAVTDGLGQRTEATLTFTLPVLPAPLVTVDPEIRFSRLTGLYEQRVTVTNVAKREIAGFDLSVSGLRAGASLYNGSSNGQIAHHQPMAAGASMTMTLEYYASPRGPIPPPRITAGVAGPEASLVLLASAAAANPVFAVNRILKQADGSVVIEFNAEPGRSYQIEYSDDAIRWKSCPVAIKAGGTKVQWIDRGPPWTDAAPSSKPCRFYRVLGL